MFAEAMRAGPPLVSRLSLRRLTDEWAGSLEQLFDRTTGLESRPGLTNSVACERDAIKGALVLVVGIDS
jgi:hypothetical protein